VSIATENKELRFREYRIMKMRVGRDIEKREKKGNQDDTKAACATRDTNFFQLSNVSGG